MAREINLQSPKDVVIVAEQKQTISTVTVLAVTDYGDKVAARIKVGERERMCVLWSSETTPTYTQAGQWTDTDVENRLNEVL